jgi:hypothetical protein
MARLNKALILEMLRKSNCIETPTLNMFFNTVWVGEPMKERIESARRKMFNK